MPSYHAFHEFCKKIGQSVKKEITSSLGDDPNVPTFLTDGQFSKRVDNEIRTAFEKLSEQELEDIREMMELPAFQNLSTVLASIRTNCDSLREEALQLYVISSSQKRA